MRLIDADALKEVFLQDRCGDNFLPKHFVISTIDNAPTVEQPTGEWVHREDMDFIDENHVVHQHFMCRKCGFIHDFIDWHTSQYKFCPQCGAKMKGGEGDD